MQRAVRFAVAVCMACLVSRGTMGQTGPRYVLTNDDNIYPNGMTVYRVGAGEGQVLTSGFGIGAGFFGTNRIALSNGASQCAYISEAGTGDIVGIDVSTLRITGTASGSASDGGTANGIGLIIGGQYLYASFTDSNAIGTFQVNPGCKLTFLGDTGVSGEQAGTINAMAVHGTMMVVTYTDGSIESFNIAGGTPVSNGDKQTSNGTQGSDGATYPSSIDISQDGRYAIFGDISTSMVVEVSDISSGSLSPTVVYNLGNQISSGNIQLSADESLLYIANTQGDRITAAFFDKTTGKVSFGCVSGTLKNYVAGWSYLGALVSTGIPASGAVLYVAEYGIPSSIAVLNVSSASGACRVTESAASPVVDPNSPGLLSIGFFPPRSF